MKYLLIFLLVCREFLFAYDLLNSKLSQEKIFKKYQRSSLQKKYVSLNISAHMDYFPKNINLNDLLDQKSKKLFTDTMYLQVFMIGTIGVLYMMPSNITNWENEGDSDLGKQWIKHVKAGPVWDKDDFAINYIGHPVSGAWYYMVAREDGFNPWESFFYSIILSTFFWEYGYEAFAEIPSAQDLIFTPAFGALFGEGFYYLQNKLDANNGIIWGSKELGNIAYFFLNPISRITDSIDSYFNVHAIFRYQTFQSPQLTQVSLQLRDRDYIPTNYGFILEIKF